MNSVHIGNYGVKDEDVESDNVKNWDHWPKPENSFRAAGKGSLDEYLKANRSFVLKV
jgi:carbamoyl-phosphate synthase small subunit